MFRKTSLAPRHCPSGIPAGLHHQEASAKMQKRRDGLAHPAAFLVLDGRRVPFPALAYLCYILRMPRPIIVRRALSLALLFIAGCLLAASKDNEPANGFTAT